ncbi:MAG: mitochondrial fission ELM1 family protein [Candidatus Poribacteria bacterium]
MQRSSIPQILVLSDGKAGHYNQSLGIIDRLDNVNAQIVQVKFKKKWRDNLIRVFGYILGGTKIPDNLILSILNWGLDKSSIDELLQVKDIDIILSTGSSVASPNLLLGKLINAKSVVCTRPSPLGIRHFDLAILPEHSRPRKIPSNVVMTFGVPNRITPETVRIAGLELSQTINISGKPIIGVLLGGDDPYYRITTDIASNLVDILEQVCKQIDAQFALTTSRRTSDQVENILKSKLEDNPLCCLFVSAKESVQSNVVQGILGISGLTIVTEDSFSMVCESTSSGKKTLILNVERKKGKPYNRREKVYRVFVNEGYTKRSDLQDLLSNLIDYTKDKSNPKILNDSQVAAEALKRLLVKD